jgi:hypothetical protein
VVGRLLACSLVAACGRLDFDPASTTDATTDTKLDDDAAIAFGHDEDGDSIPDAVDTCPHDPTPTADSDGDGVGDVCDPNPAQGTEHWALFATMQAGDVPFSNVTGTTQDADALHVAAMNQDLPLTRVITTTTRIQLGFEIRGLFGTGQRQIAFGVERGAEPYYFIELNDNGGGADLGIVSYDATNGYVQLDTDPVTSMHAGRGFLRLDAVGGTSPTYTTVGGWLGELYTATAATPAYDGGIAIRTGYNGLDVVIEYLAIIETL